LSSSNEADWLKKGPNVNPSGFKLSDESFNQIASIIYNEAGITLKQHKKPLVVSRLSKRLRKLGMTDFSQYLRYLKESAQGGQELIHLINNLTTNKTDFFREPHHFEFLRDILPQIVEEGERLGRRRLRIWSSACSTGEEPYTIAMVLHDFFQNIRGWEVKILASDIDTNVLQHASRGIYRKDLLAPVPPMAKSKYFDLMHRPDGECYHVKEILRQMVLFRKINLINDDFRFKFPLDIVFCRNVVIYFDDAGKQKLVDKFSRIIRPGGFIFVGHSESLLLAKKNFRFLKNTVYQKV
jgi:chemotaxis protein methyltransferase CheR